jgi:hypothetical protein
VEWNWPGKTEVFGEKTCPSATLSTTNPIWTDTGSNPGLRGWRPAANRLIRGTAYRGLHIKSDISVPILLIVCTCLYCSNLQRNMWILCEDLGKTPDDGVVIGAETCRV